MKIKNDFDRCEIVIEDEERFLWRDGTKEFYNLPKDERPDFNPYEYFDPYIWFGPVGKLTDLCHGYPPNECPPEMVEVLKNCQKLAGIFGEYVNHAFAVCLKQK